MQARSASERNPPGLPLIPEITAVKNGTRQHTKVERPYHHAPTPSDLMPQQPSGSDGSCDLPRLHDLISRHTDGLITPDEHRDLAAVLEADPEARRLWFLRNDIDLGLAASAEQNRSEIVVPDRVATAAVKRPRAASTAGFTMALAGVGALAGIAIGIFGASAVWALALPGSGAAGTTIPVLAESFEDGQAKTVPGLPRGLTDPDVDLWRGDEASVVTAMQKVDPAAGSRMLRFERATHAGENSPKSAWSDVYRLVDARPFILLAEGQPVTARLAADFSMASDACGPDEKYSVSVHLYAFDRDISDAPKPLSLGWVGENCVASGTKRVPIECGKQGWRRVTVDASLPPEAKFVLLHVSAVRDYPKQSSEPAVFAGHFVDDVTLELYVGSQR